MNICQTIIFFKKLHQKFPDKGQYFGQNSGQVLRKNSGQALAELIFALAMAILLLSGLIVAVRAGLTNTSYSQNKIISTHLAQESIEMIKAYRDEEGYNYIVEAHADDFDQAPAATLNGSTGYLVNGTRFGRVISFDDGTITDGKIITVTVNWFEQDEPNETVLKTIITDHE